MSELNLDSIVLPPKLKILEIGLLMQLDSSTPTLSVVSRNKILPYKRELGRCGYMVGLYTFPDRGESYGRYILEVRKDAHRS